MEGGSQNSRPVSPAPDQDEPLDQASIDSSDSEDSGHQEDSDQTARDRETPLITQEQEQNDSDTSSPSHSNQEGTSDRSAFEGLENTPRGGNPALGDVNRIYDCDFEGLSNRD